MKGMQVIARNEKDEFYYWGTVVDGSYARHVAKVQFHSPIRSLVPTRFVIPMIGARPCPFLRVADYVLVKTGKVPYPCWVPGRVKIAPVDEAKHDKLYTIIKFNKKIVRVLRNSIVKISKSQYKLAERYILDLQNHRRMNEGKQDNCSNVSGATPSNDNEDDGSQHSKPTNDGDSTTGENQKRLQELQVQMNRQQSDLLIELKQTRQTVQKFVEVHEAFDNQHAQLQDKHSELQHKQQELIDKQQECITHEQDTQSKVDRPSRKEDEECEHEEVEESIDEEVENRGELKEGDQVLARWSVDGWFYRGTIENVAEDGQYFISDNVGAIQKVSKKYIFTDKKDSDRIQNGNCVVARHPNYPFRYAPAQVRRLFPDLSCQVLFYDDEQTEVPREEIYKIDTELYGELVEYIMNCEKSWVGSAVVARNDDDGMYHLASIKERVGVTSKFSLRWANGQVSSQFTKHIFGTFKRRQTPVSQDHVLAVANAVSSIYLPGTVVGSNDGYIRVHFCNGTSSSQLDPQHCFWLSEDYYNDAVRFFKNTKSKKKCPCCIIC